MDHASLKQPELPASTPMTVAGQTKVSHSYVYGVNKASTLNKTALIRSGSEPEYKSPKAFHEVNGDMTFHNDVDNYNGNNNQQNQLPSPVKSITGYSKPNIMDEKHINKLIQKLPASLRESVSSIVNIAINYASSAVHSTDLLKHEVSTLKNDNKKKSYEIDELVKKCDMYKKKLDIVDDHIQGLKDNINLKDNFAVRNKQAITKLAKTNRMLIDALESLDSTSVPNLNEGAVIKDVDLAKPRPVMLLPMSTNAPPAHQLPSQVHGVSLPLLQAEPKPSTPGAPSAFGSVLIPNIFHAQQAASTSNESLNKYGTMFLTKKELDEIGNKEVEKPVEESDKLRSSLLCVVREHIKSIKTQEVMEKELTEARSTAKATLRLNKQLKVENDDLKALKTDGDNLLPTEDVEGNMDDFPIVNKQKYFNKVDERFKVLIDRGSIETHDLLLKLRRIIGHIVHAPATLNINELLRFVTHGETCKVFEVEMLNVFLLRHDARGHCMNKYNTRSTEPEVFDIEDARSVAFDVIKTGKTARLNSLARILHFKPAIDGVPGLVVRRLMSIAIKGGGRTIGCVHFLNREKTPFTEADELVAMIFSDFLNAYVQNCYHHKLLVEKDDMLKHIMTAPHKLCHFVPSRKSLSSIKSLQMSEILSALEYVIAETMKCISVRVFVNSLFSQKEEPGFMITFESSDSASEKDILKKRMLPIRFIAATSGVSGLVMTTQNPHICKGADASLNPYIDLDPTYTDSPMVTLPMKSYDGEVIAVIQMIPGGSQKLGPAEEDQIMGDGGVRKLYFLEAAELLLELLVGPSLELLSIFNDNAKTEDRTETEKFNNLMTTSVSSILGEKKNKSISLSRTSSFESIGNAKVSTFNEETLTSSLATYGAEIVKLQCELEEIKAKARDDKDSLELTIAQLGEAEKSALALATKKSDEATNALAEKERLLSEMERAVSENKRILADFIALKDASALASSNAPDTQKEVPMEEKADKHLEALTKLQSDVSQLQKQVADANEALASRSFRVAALEKEIAEQLKTSSEATAKLVSDKDNIIKILQDQIVKMAESASPFLVKADAVDDVSNISLVALDGSDGGGNMSSTTGANIDTNWIDHFDENGNKYYYNTITGETSWEKGGGGDSIASSLTAGGEWIQMQGEKGETYYFNSLTNETSWDPPGE